MDARSTTTPLPTDVLGAAGSRVPFRVGDREVTFAEALDALELRGHWETVIDEVAAGDAALEAADAGVRESVEAGLARAETVLRQRLRLTAADDYLAWLDRWELTVADCRDHLRRRAALSVGAAPSVPAYCSPEAARAHLLIEGVLEEAVTRLAEDAALAAADPASPTWLVDVVEGADSERHREPDTNAVAAVVAEHAMDWTRIEATVVVTPDDDVAHELILCVRDERAPLVVVAERIGLPVQELHASLDQLEQWLEPVLLGAEPGALLGPLVHPGGHAVVELVERHVPTSADDSVRHRAAAVLLERRAAIAMSASVRWSAGG